MIRALALLSLLAPSVSYGAGVFTQPGKIVEVLYGQRYVGIRLSEDVPILNPADCANADGIVWRSQEGNREFDIQEAFANDTNIELLITDKECLFDLPVYRQIRLTK